MRYTQRGLTEIDYDRATPGFTLFSPSYQRRTVLLNMNGDVVHEWERPGSPGSYARLLPNGNLFSSTRTEAGARLPVKGGLIQEIDWDGHVVWEYRDDNQHHDFRQCSNGNLIYLD